MTSTKDFTNALYQLPKPTEKMRKFLAAHMTAAARTSTATILAQAVGYANFGGINLQYGTLAKKLAIALKVDGNPGLSLIVDFVKSKKVTNAHWLLVMKPEFARALVAAHWVDRP